MNLSPLLRGYQSSCYDFNVTENHTLEFRCSKCINQVMELFFFVIKEDTYRVHFLQGDGYPGL